MTVVGGILVSGDHDGKIFSWTKDAAPQAEVFRGEAHPTTVTHITSFNGVVYSASTDG